MKKICLGLIYLIAIPFLGFGQTTTSYDINSAGRGGTNNTFYGTESGLNTTGSDNTFSGYLSGHSNTTGNFNVFSGSYSGYRNTTGNKNVFSGVYSGTYNTTGTGNVFSGYLSGRSNTVGINNVFFGPLSGYSNTAGNLNVFSGYKSGYSNTIGSGNVFLGANAGYYETQSNKLYIDNSSTTTPLIYGKFDTDQLGINTNDIPTGYAFAVKGKVITEEVKVQIYANWPDYVFNKDYSLPSLTEVENHINENGHLKDIPSAKDVLENGILLGDMNAKLLEKIEELTLYTIQQEKQLKEQATSNQELKQRLLKLEALLLKDNQETKN
ncbi:hypothetical protein Q4Q34_07735 [Flavivirga abyssicola]|uniref:hypothetical protein n=1 Tax=Flavivirga abyssicola TaxID=3063533 RepID=UPI0026E0F799|nr:hypothetical protein [Flavivirga sp. MEBiC07777]WVK14916.1 hypothetical protein Q4Q34_07735 [Flavivirga sp. MEBiC07777]